MTTGLTGCSTGIRRRARRRARASTRKEIIARYPQPARRCCRCCTWCSPRRATSARDGIEFCAEHARPHHGRGRRRSRPSTRCTSAARTASTTSASAPTRCARSWAATRSSPRSRSTSASATTRPPTDGKVTLEHIECNAACDYAPVMMVNWEFFDNQTPESRHARSSTSCAPASEVTPTRGRAAVHVQARSRACWPASTTAAPTRARRPARRRWPGWRPSARASVGRVRRGRSDADGAAAHASRPAGATTGSRDRPRSTPVPRVRHTGTQPELAATAAPVYERARRLRRRCAPALAHDARRGHPARQGLRAARPRRRRLPHRHEVGLHPAGRRQAALPRGQRRRVRAGHLQGHPADDGQPARAGRGRDHRVATRSGPATRSSTSAARSCTSCAGCRTAVREAYEAGYLGKDILGLRLRPRDHRARRRRRVHLRRGDGAARLARGPSRPAPAAPAVPRGRRALRLADRRQQRRVDRQRARRSCATASTGSPAMGTEKSPRASRSTRCPATSPGPGQYEAPLGITLRELLDMAGGMRDGHELKFWTPGGSSTPLLTAEHLDVPLDYEGVGAAGSMLGTKALQIFDETTCVVRAVLRWTEFYAHESCGKCTPCREGTYWLVQILRRLEDGRGHRGRPRQAARHLATTSSAGRSAPSATARPARSRRRSSTSATSTSRTSRTAAARSTRPPRPLFAADRHAGAASPMTVTSNSTAGGGAEASQPRRPRHASPSTASRSACPRARWSSGPPSCSASRSRGSATTRCSTRSAPAASAWSRSTGQRQAAGVLHHHRRRRAWSSRPSSPRRSPTRRSRA